MYLKRETILWFYAIFIRIAILKADFTLTLLHTNDMHARIEEVNSRTGKCTEGTACYGGFARVAHEAKRIKDEIKNTLFLNAGDTYQGTPIYSLFKWKPFAELVPMLHIDAMSFGNHEFDDGIEGLAPYLQKINVTVVTCNIDTTKEPSLTNQTTLKHWTMFTFDEVKIAVIGYVTPNTKHFSCPGNVEFLDEIEKITEYAKEAKEKGANLVFAVGHSGLEMDVEIAKKVPDIDVVVGGHSDSFLYTGTPPDPTDTPVGVYPMNITQDSNKVVPVVQAFGYTKYLGRLDLVWDKDFKLISATGNPILLNSSFPKDCHVERVVKKWTSQLADSLGQRIGASRVLLNGTCRLNECNLGNFITDAMVHYAVKQTKDASSSKWTDASIAIMNGGGIRTSINLSDNITWGDLLTTLPFGKKFVRHTMKGSVLRAALRRSAEDYEKRKVYGFGHFLQYSGLKVYYETNCTGHLNLVNVLARCQNCTIPRYYTLNDERYYSVVTISFLSDGGDKYLMFKNNATRDQVYEESDLEIVANYLEQMSPVYPGIDARIVITKQNDNNQLSDTVYNSATTEEKKEDKSTPTKGNNGDNDTSDNSTTPKEESPSKEEKEDTTST